MKAVILAANKSDRLSPFTETRPKPMIRIAGKHILTTMIEYLREVGIREIILVVNHKREMIQEFYAYGNEFGVKIEYVVQEALEGIGHAIKLCETFLNQDEHFLLSYGDVLANGNIFQEALKTFYETGEELAVVALPKSSQEYGNVYLDPQMKIRRWVEKPQKGQWSNYVFSGVFVLSTEIFQRLDQFQNDVEQCFQGLIQEKRLHASLWEKGWIDIIYPWNILEANKMMMNLWKVAQIDNTAILKGNVQIEGPVIIEEKVVIESGTTLKGPCFIGKNSYIGNNCLIRGYSVVGANSTIGYGSELKNCVLLGKTTIGRLSFVGDSVVGMNVNLGSGTTTVNHQPSYSEIQFQTEHGTIDSKLVKVGAFIGDDVVIGARHTLGPGTVIKPGRMIDDNISLESNI